MHTVVETFEASVGAPPANELDKDISAHVKEPDVEEKVIPKDGDKSAVDPADKDSTADETTEGQAISAGERSFYSSLWGNTCTLYLWGNTCTLYLF